MTLLKTNIKFNYNPFGGLTDEELFKVLVPNQNTKGILNEIASSEKCIIELVGKKGRGKTSHLKLLYKLLGKGALYQLSETHKPTKEMLEDNSEVIFIDSFHHLKLLDRIKLLKIKKKLILTTHYSRILEYKMAGVAFKSYRFKGIEKEMLRQILINRIVLAAKHTQEILIDDRQVETLINKYKDDFRAILKNLYLKFKSE